MSLPNNKIYGEIWQVKLYPVRGSEQDGIRPCLIVSPNSMNRILKTIIVLPLTTSLKEWPTRVKININAKVSQACIEHIRSVSKERFLKKIGVASDIELAAIRKHILATFSV
ncbi:MAG: type II toxin-antitoxin system PemK/MazF family toxin [Bdellovibrionales bacterium]